MRVTTKIVVDMNTGAVLAHDWFEYSGPVASCKGDSAAKQAEKQSLTFGQKLMGMFSQQFGAQSTILKFLAGKMTDVISKGGEGYSPQALAAARTNATQTVASQYQSAEQAAAERIAAQGGAGLPSGVQAQIQGQIALAAAGANTAAQNEITLANEDARKQSYWAAVNALGGTAAQFDPLGYSASAQNSFGNVASLSSAVTQSRQSGWTSVLGGALGGVAGAALGPGGALGKALPPR